MSLEPLYSLEVAAELIPCTFDALKHIISRRASELGPPTYHAGGEARYRNGKLVDYSGGHPLRMLTESDCLKIRDMLTRGNFKRLEPKTPYGGNGGAYHGPGRTKGSINKVWDLLTADLETPPDKVENVG